MRKLSRWLVPFSRTTILLWTWRNRATVMEWLTFGLRADREARLRLARYVRDELNKAGATSRPRPNHTA